MNFILIQIGCWENILFCTANPEAQRSVNFRYREAVATGRSLDIREERSGVRTQPTEGGIATKAKKGELSSGTCSFAVGLQHLCSPLPCVNVL